MNTCHVFLFKWARGGWWLMFVVLGQWWKFYIPFVRGQSLDRTATDPKQYLFLLTLEGWAVHVRDVKSEPSNCDSIALSRITTWKVTVIPRFTSGMRSWKVGRISKRKAKQFFEINKIL